MRLRRGLQALSGVVLAGIAPLLAADDAAVRDAVRIAQEKFARAEVAGDVAGMMEIYAEDAVLFPPGEDPVSGRIAAAAWMRRRQTAATRISREQFETSSLDVCADLAIETGSVAREREAPGSAPATTRTAYMTVWKRQGDGSWKIQKDMWNRPGPVVWAAGAPSSRADLPAPAPASAPAMPAPAAPASPALPPPMAPPADFISIPDPRGLSEGFVRTTGDQLRARAGKIRALEAAHASEQDRLTAVRRADRELQSLIRDVGWIDVTRFGVAASCDAAFIVARSGDPALIKSAVPWMKDLQSNEQGVDCYRIALEAYEKLPR